MDAAYVNVPPLSDWLQGATSHAITRAVERGYSAEAIRDTIVNPVEAMWSRHHQSMSIRGSSGVIVAYVLGDDGRASMTTVLEDKGWDWD